jgi:hypothetical protein
MDIGGTSNFSPAIVYLAGKNTTNAVVGLCDLSELDLNGARGLRRHDCDDEFL